jgi:XTP/dITP diphosphohydrolase
MAQKFEKLLIATGNPAKLKRYRAILSKFAAVTVGLSDEGIDVKPEESGETAEENALIKARFYAQQSDLPVFANDAALYVDFLPHDRQPGVHVRRINGADEASDDDLFNYWLCLITDIPEVQRTGKWHVAYCIVQPNGREWIFSLDYPIRFYDQPSPVRIPGWPISSLEGPASSNKPHSEMTEDELNHLNAGVDLAIARLMDRELRLL